MRLTKNERFLLDLLSKGDRSAFGECHGRSLDNLVLNGLVEISGTGGRASVSVTPAGRLALEAEGNG